MKTCLHVWFVVVAIAAIVFGCTSSSAYDALRVRDGQVISFERLMEEVRTARVIFIGEDHGQRASHHVQLEAIRRLRESGAQVAIGLEMFTTGTQADLDRWVAGQLGLEEFVRLYDREWHMPWRLYRDILLYARDHRIALVALNVPRTITRKVAQEGFASLTPRERLQLPSGVACTVDPAYRRFIREAYSEHGGTGKSFTYFCEAQMLWNKSMGLRVRDYLERNPKATVVVLAGVGHAMKGGIPQEIFGAIHYGYAVILPELSRFDRRTVTSRQADYLMLFEN